MIDAPKVPFADLGWQWRQIRQELKPRLDALFESSAYVLGPAVAEFERDFASAVGVTHAIAVNSGTSALHLAFIAAGIKAGDKVLMPSHTFVATAWAAAYVGAEPVLCYVDRASGTIDLADAERRMTEGVTAIVPVHLYGQPADMDAVTAFARRHGLIVIEDAAQAHLAAYRGRKVGSIGAFGCFSFYPGKNLGAAGEAGMVTTNDSAAAERIANLRNHAQPQRYYHNEIGYNYRMEGIQGLVLGAKLKRLADWTDMRRAVARRYLDALNGLPLELPEIVQGDHVYHLFVVRTEQRDALATHLKSLNVESGLHYPVPLHRQECFAHLDAQPCPESDRWATQGLSLPIFAGMTEAQIDQVIAAVRSFFAAGAAHEAAQ